jgi:hypothetical protein
MEIDDDEADSCSLERRLAMREICEPTGLKRLPLDYYLHPLIYSVIQQPSPVIASDKNITIEWEQTQV